MPSGRPGIAPFLTLPANCFPCLRVFPARTTAFPSVLILLNVSWELGSMASYGSVPTEAMREGMTRRVRRQALGLAALAGLALTAVVVLSARMPGNPTALYALDPDELQVNNDAILQSLAATPAAAVLSNKSGTAGAPPTCKS